MVVVAGVLVSPGMVADARGPWPNPLPPLPTPHLTNSDSGYIQESIISKEGCTLGRTLNLAECKRCHELLPVLKLEQCHHSFCGECIPFLIHAGGAGDALASEGAVGPCVTCCACVGEEEGHDMTWRASGCAGSAHGGEPHLPSTVPISLLGNFMDHLMMMHTPAAS